jgi:hypothetical protein
VRLYKWRVKAIVDWMKEYGLYEMPERKS